jgi:hypothetical protein
LPCGSWKAIVAPLTKLLPLISSVWELFDPGTGLGDTPLMEGAGFEFETDQERTLLFFPV